MKALTRSQKTAFRRLWQNTADEYDFYNLAKTVKPDLTFSTFDHAWQYTVVLHPNYHAAEQEFVAAVWHMV